MQLCRGDGRDIDRFRGGEDPFLLTSDRNLIHNLIPTQWDIVDDIRSITFSLTPLSGDLGW